MGLAATQVDVHKRVIVLDVSETRDQPLVLINPEILSNDGDGPGEEGCLSLPGIYDKLTRATHIRVRALGRTASPFEMEARGHCSAFAFSTKWITWRASCSSTTSPS